MADTNIISINQLVGMFKDFSEAHLQINDFGYGPTSEIGVNRQAKYPLLWITHRGSSDINVTNKTQIPEMNLSFIIVDRINIQKNYGDNMGLNGDNSQEVLSDTFQITQDLVNFVSTTMGQFGVQLTEDGLSTEPLFDETQDKVSGWITDMSLRLKHVNCVTPMGDVEITIPSQSNISLRYLTCDTLSACTSFSSTDNYVESGVYNSSTESIDFTGTFSGATFSVSLKQIEDRINTNQALSEQNEANINNNVYQLLLNKNNIINNTNNIDDINAQLITGGTYDTLTETLTLEAQRNPIEITGFTSGGGDYGNFFDYTGGTTTTISSTGVYYKVNANTTSNFTKGFTHSNGRLTKDGDGVNPFKLEGNIAFQGSNNDEIHVLFYKSGDAIPCSLGTKVISGSGKGDTIPFHCMTDMVDGDYIEVYVSNESGARDVTLENMNIMVTEL